MRKLAILLSLVIGFFIQTNAQRVSYAEHIFDVDGVCEMCKSRIEKACSDTKGVVHAEWNIDTHKLTVIINEKKVKLTTVHQNIANAGHDTEMMKAPQEAYDALKECCKYRDKDKIKKADSENKDVDLEDESTQE